MNNCYSDKYRNWQINIRKENKMCSNFCFDITDPKGKKQHITMGGDTEKRALERAQEMIDMEIEFAAEN